MEEYKIKLGDKVRDKISGYTGIAVARSKFINGCVQYSIAGKVKKGERLPIEGEPAIDETNLEIIKKNVVISCEYRKEEHKETKSNGGPTRFMKSMRGY